MSPRVIKGTGIIGLVGLLVAIVFLMTPVDAHVTRSFRHLWRDHIKPKLATAGTINDLTNPVDWTKLKGVPPDFADGVDDVGGGGGGGGGLHNVTIVTVASGLSAVNTRGDTALCPVGDTIVGGGADLTGLGFPNVALDRSEPTASGDGWVGGAHEHTPTGDDWELEVHAICATP
jgi:hypothetical protein